MSFPSPQFAGFFTKVTCENPEGLRDHGVTEVCSVSNCISAGSDDWIKHWTHNVLGFYDSEAAALALLTDESERYDLYAYKLFPVRFQEGKVDPFVVEVNPEGDLDGYTFLGYDAASRSASFFECSPLSCNYAAKEFPVNKYCLLDDLERAYEAAIAFSEGNYEPGPYHLLEVYRKRQ